MMPHFPPSMRRTKTSGGVLLFVLLVILTPVFSACGNTNQQSTVLSIPEQEPFTQNNNPFISDNNPGKRGLMYETLLFINNLQNTVTPWLASDYQFSPDATTLTFHIRPNVRWSDSQPFSSADVIFTLNMLKQYPALDTLRLWNYLKNVSAPNDRTVIVTLQKPYFPILLYLGGRTWIVPQHIWSDISDPIRYMNPKPVVTGPFMLKSSSPQLIVLTRNPHYWQAGKPAVTEVRFPGFDSNNSTLLQLQQGNLDWSGAFVPNIQKTYISRDPAHNHYWYPSTSVYLLSMNLTKYPFNLLPVRQAISLAIDRQQLSTDGESGYDPPANPTGLALPMYEKFLSPTYAHVSFTLDPGKAEQTLQSAGFTKGPDGIYADKSGKKLEFSIETVTGFTDWITDSQIIASNLKTVGIKVSVNTVSFGAYLNALQIGNFDAAITTPPVSASGPTPFFFFDPVLNSNNTAPIGKTAASNWGRWSDPTTDNLLKQYVSSTNQEVQLQALSGLQKIMVEQLPVIPLLSSVTFNEYSTTRFTGWASEGDPYAVPTPVAVPDIEVIILRLHPIH